MSTTVTIEEIKREIEKVPVDRLEELYNYVRDLADIEPQKITRETFLERMERIRIDAPADFAANIDDYLYGGKEIAE